MINKNKTEFSLYCSCGCNNGVLLRVRGDDEVGAVLSLVSDNYYISQEKGFKSLAKRIRRIWAIIRSKEYCYFEICIEPEDIITFKEFVAKIPSKEIKGDCIV